MSVPSGVRLGVDPGDARIGVARTDPAAILATPEETVSRSTDGSTADLDRLATLVEETRAVVVYVGLPRSLSGGEGPAAGRVREFARDLATRIDPCPVHLVDERLSTVTAEAVLRERGKKGQKRRAVVDQAAAVVILQSAIDRILSRGILGADAPIIGAGVGRFLVREAARRLRRPYVDFAELVTGEPASREWAARCAPVPPPKPSNRFAPWQMTMASSASTSPPARSRSTSPSPATSS